LGKNLRLPCRLVKPHVQLNQKARTVFTVRARK
jgi:hypothetical protein